MKERHFSYELFQFNTISPPTVFTGLWGDSKHHRYQMLANIFYPLGASGDVVGNRSVVSLEKYIKNIEKHLISLSFLNRSKILIGNSLGATILLLLLHQHPEVDFEHVYLLGYDPKPIERWRSFPERQKEIWRGMGIEERIINDFLNSLETIPQKEIDASLRHFLNDPRIVFIHGQRDETVPIEELKAIRPCRFYEIKGMDHNSVRNLEKVLTIIWKDVTGYSFVPLRRNEDLLDVLELSKGREMAGMMPFLSGNRIGFGVLIKPEQGKINLIPFQNNYFYLGLEKEIPNGYLKLAKLGEFIFAINLSELKNSFVFYPPLIPPRSIFPQAPWVEISYQIHLETKERLVTTSEDENISQMEEDLRRKIHEKYRVLFEKIEFTFTRENNLMRHVLEVKKTLEQLGFNEDMAIFLAFWHDAGKGLYILFTELEYTEKIFSKETLDEEDKRRVGKYRDIFQDKSKLRQAIEDDRQKVSSLMSEINIASLGISHDRVITEKLLQFYLRHQRPIFDDDRLRIIENYLNGRFSEDIKAQLLRLADLISPYLAFSSDINIETIIKAVETRLAAINQRYGKSLKVGEIITPEILEYLRKKKEN